MPNRSNSRGQNPGAAAGTALPPPPTYAQAAPGPRGRRDRNDDSTGRGSEVPNHRRRGSGTESRGTAAGGSFRSGSGTVAATNQQDASRGGHGGGGSSKRVVHRVGMECLSPISIAKDGHAGSQGGWVGG